MDSTCQQSVHKKEKFVNTLASLKLLLTGMCLIYLEIFRLEHPSIICTLKAAFSISFLKIYFLERVPDERTDCHFGDIFVHTP